MKTVCNVHPSISVAHVSSESSQSGGTSGMLSLAAAVVVVGSPGSSCPTLNWLRFPSSEGKLKLRPFFDVADVDAAGNDAGVEAHRGMPAVGGRVSHPCDAWVSSWATAPVEVAGRSVANWWPSYPAETVDAARQQEIFIRRMSYIYKFPEIEAILK